MLFHHTFFSLPLGASSMQADSRSDTGSNAAVTSRSETAGRAEAGPTMLDGAVLLAGVVATWWVVRCGWHRLAHLPARTIEPSVPWLVLTLAAAYLAGRAAIEAALVRLDIHPERTANWLELLELRDVAILHGASTLAQAALIMLALCAWRLVTPPTPIHLRTGKESSIQRPAHLKALSSGAASIVLAWPIAAACGLLTALVMHAFGVGSTHVVAHETLERLLHAPRDGWFLAMIAVVLVLVPVAEELLYRGVIQSLALRMGLHRWPAIIVTSAFFTAMHIQAVEPHALASLFALSLGLGLVFERTRSLLAPIALHAMFNAGNLLAALSSNGQ